MCAYVIRYSDICSIQTKRSITQLNNKIMKYTTKQIENAKRNYDNMLVIKQVSSFNSEVIGVHEAESRCEYHNNIVRRINSGDKALEREWKLFFLMEEVKLDQEKNKRKEKIKANRGSSSDILAPIRKLRKLGEFGKWLNTSGNPYRTQHFRKKYTEQAVNEFLQTI